MRILLQLALAVLAALACAWPLASHAHKASDSYLSLNLAGSDLTGRWDIALQDLDLALHLDRDGDGAITWRELRDARPAIDALALSHLAVASGDRACRLDTTSLAVDHHTDGAYAVIGLAGRCAGASARVTVRYDLLFDLDALHKGLIQVSSGESATAAVVSSANRAAAFDVRSPDRVRSALTFALEGVRHIASGWDHLLFVVSLILPAVLVRSRGEWVPARDGRAALWDAAKVITGFTIAHSATLVLSATGRLALEPALVETAIALSVLAAAANNVVPVLAGYRSHLAFAFGLVHGLGFASSLRELEIPTALAVESLLAFNLGVEAGQLAIVGALFPILYFVRGHALYRPVVLVGGSCLVGVLAAVWAVERAFDLKLLPA